jgi:hypothetical protein
MPALLSTYPHEHWVGAGGLESEEYNKKGLSVVVMNR